MRPPRDLPPELADSFTVRHARHLGASTRRLRARDLERPYPGVRSRISAATGPAASDSSDDRDERIRRELLDNARAYASRLRPGQFFSHATAALIWGAPVPVSASDPLHVSTIRPARAPHCAGILGHELGGDARPVTVAGLPPITSPAVTWAQLGALPVADLVAVGDYFVRVWRPGHFRPGAGTPALTDREALRRAVNGTRRHGAARLREALTRIREDSWSPAESKLRCVLYDAGLPEPSLNLDVFSEHGMFLGCVDLAFPEYKVAVEYHGKLHRDQYAHDVDRIARLRAHGWDVIEVTWPLLFRRPDELVARIRAALRTRGCRGV